MSFEKQTLEKQTPERQALETQTLESQTPGRRTFEWQTFELQTLKDKLLKVKLLEDKLLKVKLRKDKLLKDKLLKEKKEKKVLMGIYYMLPSPHTTENGPSGFKSKHLNFFFDFFFFKQIHFLRNLRNQEDVQVYNHDLFILSVFFYILKW